jgi:hypothetical protein
MSSAASRRAPISNSDSGVCWLCEYAFLQAFPQPLLKISKNLPLGRTGMGLKVSVLGDLHMVKQQLLRVYVPHI